ncbi:hypothetical protein DSO57_1036210 [Entomophthora muscae]|uniref:Uncharacterized protein n=1 Tax=Entomophthora muscae TaxID=34485 RepID=A0ACC2SNA2_9FUNG|nr:hypothetical protein DSO57_1036210 [Entomophthora muscae]
MPFSTSYSFTFSKLSHHFNKVVESVENWRKVKDSIVSIKALFTSKAAASGLTEISANVATIAAPLVKCINSEHNNLAKEAIDLSSFLSSTLKSGFAAHVNQFCPALIQTLGKTNKVCSSQGFAALSTIVANVKSIFVVHQICSAAICKSFIARPLSAKLFLQLIGSFSAQILLKGCNDIEKVFSQGLADPVLHIKEVFRSAFQTYVQKLPLRLEPLFKSLPKEVLKFFDQSRAISSAQIIQVASKSVKLASKVPTSVQPIKKSLSIQVGHATSSSDIAFASSSVPKHQKKPSSVRLSKNPTQASAMSSPSTAAYSVTSATRRQLKRSTIINEKIPDYSHIKSKVYQEHLAPVQMSLTSQSPSTARYSIPCPRATTFSQSSKYAIAITKEVPSSQKAVPYSHTLCPSQKPDGGVSQTVSSPEIDEPSPSLFLGQKPFGPIWQKMLSPRKYASYSPTLSQKSYEAVSQKISGSKSCESCTQPLLNQKPSEPICQTIPSPEKYGPSTSSFLGQKPFGPIWQKRLSPKKYAPYSPTLSQKSYEAVSQKISGSKSCESCTQPLLNQKPSEPICQTIPSPEKYGPSTSSFLEHVPSWKFCQRIPSPEKYELSTQSSLGQKPSEQFHQRIPSPEMYEPYSTIQVKNADGDFEEVPRPEKYGSDYYPSEKSKLHEWIHFYYPNMSYHDRILSPFSLPCIAQYTREELATLPFLDDVFGHRSTPVIPQSVKPDDFNNIFNNDIDTILADTDFGLNNSNHYCRRIDSYEDL